MQRKEWLLSKPMWGKRDPFFCELAQHLWVSWAGIGKVFLLQGSPEAWHRTFSFSSVIMWIWCCSWRFWKRFSEVVSPTGHCICIYRAGYANREELAGFLKAVGEPATRRNWLKVLHDKKNSERRGDHKSGYGVKARKELTNQCLLRCASQSRSSWKIWKFLPKSCSPTFGVLSRLLNRLSVRMVDRS